MGLSRQAIFKAEMKRRAELKKSEVQKSQKTVVTRKHRLPR